MEGSGDQAKVWGHVSVCWEWGQPPTVSLKLSESQRFLRTASTEDGGFSRSSKASMRMKSSTMSKKLIHTTCGRQAALRLGVPKLQDHGPDGKTGWSGPDGSTWAGRHISTLQWRAAGAISLTAWAWGRAGQELGACSSDGVNSDPQNQGRARHRPPTPHPRSRISGV